MGVKLLSSTSSSSRKTRIAHKINSKRLLRYIFLFLLAGAFFSKVYHYSYNNREVITSAIILKGREEREQQQRQREDDLGVKDKQRIDFLEEEEAKTRTTTTTTVRLENELHDTAKNILRAVDVRLADQLYPSSSVTHNSWWLPTSSRALWKSDEEYAVRWKNFRNGVQEENDDNNNNNNNNESDGPSLIDSTEEEKEAEIEKGKEKEKEREKGEGVAKSVLPEVISPQISAQPQATCESLRPSSSQETSAAPPENTAANPPLSTLPMLGLCSERFVELYAPIIAELSANHNIILKDHVCVDFVSIEISHSSAIVVISPNEDIKGITGEIVEVRKMRRYKHLFIVVDVGKEVFTTLSKVRFMHFCRRCPLAIFLFHKECCLPFHSDT